ncbi:hypothetical protein HYH03_004826 [Edaphochlamys debaryana]|uniref:Uncharacterized protein n=1 Tax=Edaphochlamys debaryana TaxID=47281 RepID=A0A835Y728_9CHLO|nr:hypothetical protein HYH03_004826 [Edaphochlamys debaryana]|eukprot:KAG2497238.1 hypothetical protein HYH03_004826 [Edaphochlamys debaryana]
MSKLLARASRSLGRKAVVFNKQAFSYEQVLTAAETIRASLAKHLPGGSGAAGNGGGGPEQPPRVGLFASPGPEYLAATWAVWQAGGIVVPLATSHPPPELDYVCRDAGVAAVLAPPDQETRLGPITRRAGAALQLLEPLTGGTPEQPRGRGQGGAAGASGPGAGSGELSAADAADLADLGSSSGRGALIIYTSGTTGKPKGVLHSHRSLHAQVASLASAWRWAPSDRLLHCLPLHHIHGIVNGLYCPAAVGAAVEFAPKFSPQAVWARLESGDVSVFMGVPTMYSYLLAQYDAAGLGPSGPERQAAMRAAAAGLRLTVSGSSACPVPIMNSWKELSGSYLLERYGMTEIGMALSNPYEGERRPGSVGQPLPAVEVRLAGDGQLLVRGPAVFGQYWGRPEATAEAFDAEGYFLTGDTASVSGSPPYWAIEGRTSVDILKSGGYKISALQIESAILEHPGVGEVAVLGVPDQALGEAVTALLAPKPGPDGPGPRPSDAELGAFCRERLAPYQVPRRWHWVSALPRNAMGKVNKKELLRLYTAGQLA